MERQDIIIIGAGISGLSLAHYCAREGLKTLVIEKDERAGGAFHTHRFDGEASGFWIELGAHTCYNSYSHLIGIMEDLNIADRLMRREKVPYRMLVDDTVKSIPSQINFLELLLSAPRIFTLKKQGLSVESYYSRIVGRKNFEKVFAHVLNAVPSQRTNDFPADMLFKKRVRRKDILKSFTLREGLRGITDAIASQGGIKILTGQEVTEIKYGDGFFTAVTSEGLSYESSFLASAAPAPAAARLLRPLFPDISAELAKINGTAIESLGVAVEEEALSLERIAGIIPTDDRFYSIVSRDTVGHDRYRGFTFHFKPGLMDVEAKLGRVSEVLGIKRDTLRFIAVKENYLPSLKVGHDEIISAIDKLLMNGRLFLAGNYFGGIAIEDCVSRSLREFNRLRNSLS